MTTFRSAMVMVTSLIISTIFVGSVEAQSVTISNLLVDTSGTSPVLTAKVTATELPDGEYTFRVLVTNETAGGTSKSITGTFTVTNGVGNLNIIGAFPATSPGDAGILELWVEEPNSGIGDGADADWRVPGGG